jgi:hypothetical protein
MKHIKRFSENEKVNEEVGALLIGGIAFAALAGPGLIKWAKAAWTKKMMEMKYKPTGKEEMVPFGKGEVKFEEVKDSSTGETFWGVTYVDKTVADPGYEDEQYLLFDGAGFKKIKEEMASGKFSTSGSVKSWSKTPSNAKDGSESY